MKGTNALPGGAEAHSFAADPAKPRKRPAAVRLAGAAGVIVFLALVVRFWSPVYGFTAFMQLDQAYDAVKIPELRDTPVFVFPDPGAYDGVAYAQIAYHPLLNAPGLAAAVDTLSYRARRILAPALAWALAAGDPALIAQTYCLLNVLAWLALAALLWRLLPVDTAEGRLGWAGILFSAGALYSVRFALPDLVALALMAAGMAAFERGGRAGPAGWLAAAALTRETSLLAWPGFCVRPWFSRRNLATLGLAALPLAGWFLYIRGRLGSPDAGMRNFQWPLVGLAAKWREAAAALTASNQPLLACAALLALAGIVVQAAFFVLRPKPSDPWWRLGALYVPLMVLLGDPVWQGLQSAAQRVLLPLTLGFNVLAGRGRDTRAWLVAGNLGILAGVCSLCPSPFIYYRELLAARQDGRACAVRTGDGFFPCETRLFHTWSWSGERGRLEVRAWPRAPQRITIEFGLRSDSSRIVAVSQDGRVLWRGPVGRKNRRVAVEVLTANGHAWLDFSTDAPAELEPGDPANARMIAFAVSDLKLDAIRAGGH